MKTLDVPGAVYAALRALAQQAELPLEDDSIPLRNVILRARPGGTTLTNLAVSTLLSSRTQEGRVELAMNGELTQMDLPKARELVGMLQEAIEAAASDQMLYIFLTERVGLDANKAAMALADFREIRQGSKGLVHPS